MKQTKPFSSDRLVRAACSKAPDAKPDHLAAIAGVSRVTFFRSVLRLSALGLLRVVKTGRYTRKYVPIEPQNNFNKVVSP